MVEVPMLRLGEKVKHVGSGKKGEITTQPGKTWFFNSRTRQIHVTWNGGNSEWVDSVALEEM